MTLDTLMLLEQILCAQQLHVGDSGFDEMAQRVLVAKDELRQAILLHLSMQDNGDAKV